MEGGDGPRGGGLVTGESKISRLRVLFFFFPFNFEGNIVNKQNVGDRKVCRHKYSRAHTHAHHTLTLTHAQLPIPPFQGKDFQHLSI